MSLIILMKKNFSNEFPFSVKLRVWIYHFLKTAYLLLTTPKLFMQYKKLKKVRDEIEEKRKDMKRAVSASDIAKFIN